MQIGCHLPTQGPVATREALTTFCRQAEEHQMASLWVSDHVVFPRTGNSNYPSGRFPHAPPEHLQQIAEEAGRPFDTLDLSLRLPLHAEVLQGSRQAIIDQYGAYKALGLSHLALDFRRDELSQMLEVLELVATEIRPAVQAA